MFPPPHPHIYSMINLFNHIHQFDTYSIILCPVPSSYTLSPADLTELHVIRYEYERDLLPLVLSNCQYSMERGQETLLECDLPKIQQQILTRFLQGKPHITINVCHSSR